MMPAQRQITLDRRGLVLSVGPAQRGIALALESLAFHSKGDALGGQRLSLTLRDRVGVMKKFVLYKKTISLREAPLSSDSTYHGLVMGIKGSGTILLPITRLR